jgi:hypothetical protein
VVRHGELQATLERLPLVEAVRVVEAQGHIAEVHVLASPGKPPKQLVRDIQSLAMAAFGVEVDRRAVSVVQIENERIAPAARPSIVDIRETPDGAHLQMDVRLNWHNVQYGGSTTGPASQETRPRLVGEATLRALEGAADGDVAFALSNMDLVTVGPRTICVAVVVMVANGEERSLVGSALVGTDPAQAAVRAVLDALNRQMPQLQR